MGKTVGEKHLIDKLNDYSSQEAAHFTNQKEVYFDAMEEAIKSIKEHFEKADGSAIKTLYEKAETLTDDKENVNDVLEDVKITIEFDID